MAWRTSIISKIMYATAWIDAEPTYSRVRTHINEARGPGKLPMSLSGFSDSRVCSRAIWSATVSNSTPLECQYCTYNQHSICSFCWFLLIKSTYSHANFLAFPIILPLDRQNREFAIHLLSRTQMWQQKQSASGQPATSIPLRSFSWTMNTPRKKRVHACTWCKKARIDQWPVTVQSCMELIEAASALTILVRKKTPMIATGRKKIAANLLTS